MSKTMSQKQFASPYISETKIILHAITLTSLLVSYGKIPQPVSLFLHAKSETEIVFMIFKNYSTSASNILREAFYYQYLQTV